MGLRFPIVLIIAMTAFQGPTVLGQDQGLRVVVNDVPSLFSSGWQINVYLPVSAYIGVSYQDTEGYVEDRMDACPVLAQFSSLAPGLATASILVPRTSFRRLPIVSIAISTWRGTVPTQRHHCRVSMVNELGRMPWTPLRSGQIWPLR